MIIKTLFGGREWSVGTVFVTAGLAALALSACGDREPAGDKAASDPSVEARSDRQTAFRVREAFDAALDSDRGWAGAIDEPATALADRPFRLRFEVSATDEADRPRHYRLETRRNGGAWEPLPAENFPQPEKVHEFPLGSPDRAWRVVRGEAASLRARSDDGDEYLEIATGDQPLLVLGEYAVHWQPVEFAAELRFDDPDRGRAGLVFDYRNAENYSRVDVIAPDSVRLVRVEEGEAAILAEHSAEVASGRWLELKTIFADDGLLVEFDDEALVFSAPLDKGFSPLPGIYMPGDSVANLASIVVEGEPRSPRTSIVASPVFAHGEPTSDLLPVSDRPFTGGNGVSFAEFAPPWTPEVGHGEWEFPIVIRKFSDRAAMNESGDRFDYRLVERDAGPLASEAVASVTLEVPDGHVGGTFVETPMRLGPWQADSGDLYFPMEPSETWNQLMMIKSSNGGRSWREVDGVSRPETGDLEGFASVLHDDRIHMLHQTSDDVWYHAFNTSDHPDAPDTWAVRDERLASPEEPPTQVADLAVRSDGSIVAVYGGPDDIRLRIRSAGGQWSERQLIDADGDAVLSGPTLVLGRDDIVHLAYTGSDGSAWYRRITPQGELGEADSIATNLGTGSEDVGSILPLLYLPQSDTVSLIYRSAEELLHERRVSGDGEWSEPRIVSDRLVVQNAVDADQVGADAVVDGDRIHLLLIEQAGGRLFHVIGEESGWRESGLQVDGENVQWVRGAVIERSDGTRAYGYVYDGGSDGGSGMNRYRSIELPAH